MYTKLSFVYISKKYIYKTLKTIHIMKIKKQWLVMQNNYLVVLVKTEYNLYFYFEESNKGAFEKIEKETAKELIKKTKKHYGWMINR